MHYIFLFINPNSGSKLGDQICNLGLKDVDFNMILDKQEFIKLHFCNVMSSEELLESSIAIQQILGSNESIRIIIGGGDGTNTLVIKKLLEIGVNIDNCYFGFLPLGTGNHLSWNLGWGNSINRIISKIGFTDIKRRINQWMKAKVIELDLWDVEIECFENGGFKKIYHDRRNSYEKFMSKVSADGTECKLLTYQDKMTNYFSFGYDAEVGFEFEKERKKTRAKNFFTYFLAGCNKSIKHVPRIHEMIESIEKLKHSKNDQNKQAYELDYMIFLRKRTNPVQCLSSAHLDLYQNIKHVSVILFLNIPSYAGRANVWNYKKARGGLQDSDTASFKPIKAQEINDGLLEMIVFDSPFSLVRGKADRILQTEGPIQIKFFKSEDENKPNSMFFEINGEHLEVVSPKRILIKRSQDPSKINCLYKKMKNKRYLFSS